MRIFLASPSDVSNYRAATQRVAERLNQRHGAKLGADRFIELVDWNSHVAHLQSLPESAILEEIAVGEHDVFLGIAWLAFDQQAADGQGLALSTERNFELAFNFWKGQQPQHCFLCRCMRLPDKLTDIDGRAFDRVSRFFSRFTLDGENPVHYYEFDSATDLEEHLVSELSELVAGLDGGEPARAAAASAAAPQQPRTAASPAAAAQASAAPAEAARDGGAEAAPTTEFERKMQPGKAYEVSFLSVEIVENEPIAQARREKPVAVETLYTAFKGLVATIAAAYGGEIFSWKGSGGQVIFWSSRSYDHAIMTGLKVLHNLPIFNLDTAQNPVGAGIKTRSAAHDAVIIFQLPASRIESGDIDFVKQLQRQSTDPAELTITRRLLERIDNRLKPHFKFKGRFENEPIYACQLPSTDQATDPEQLQDFSRRLSHQAAMVREVLSTPASSLDASALDAMSTAIEEMYSILNKFCTAFSNVDVDWPADFLALLADTTAELMREEAEVWGGLRKSYVSGSFTAGKARQLEAIVHAASRRRSRPVVILEKLAERCRSLAGDGPAEAAPAVSEEELDQELMKKVEAFIKADVLDNETLLTELLLNFKKGLLAFLTRSTSDRRHRPLRDKLWETADLALLDDLYSIRGRQRSDEKKVFDVLVSDAVADGRFRVVRRLLEGDKEPTDGLLDGELKMLGVEPSEDDRQIVWRCMVLGHESPEIKNYAAFKLTPFSLWQVISHPSIPIASIHAIGERVNKVEGEDAQKIFFDCIRAWLESAVESFRTREEVSSLTKLILLLLDFPFLVESGYFERFDDILRKFLDRANKAGLKVDYFESLRKTLEEARKNVGDKGPSKPPAGIKKLPLTIQRRLAGEAQYVYWFVSHPDPRIAGETLRHVGLMNVERVLRLREVNKSVLTAILRKPELFTRSQALIAALNHPKCDQNFAGRHIPSLARSRGGVQELQKIANNPSANPVVRSAAQRALAGQARGAARR